MFQRKFVQLITKRVCQFLIFIYALLYGFYLWIPSVTERLVFQPPNQKLYHCKHKHLYVTNSSGNQVAAIYFKRKDAKYTVLYSHGNGEDLSHISEFLKEFSKQLNVNVISYDYSGYGLSQGSPSRDSLYDDSDAMYNYITDKLNISGDKIILYGVSIGSIPATYLASKYNKQNQIGGLILQSAFTSVLTMWIPSILFENVTVNRILSYIFHHDTIVNVDVFRNIDFIENIVNCPVLLIHGTNDYLVPFSNGMYLYKRLKEINSNIVHYFWARNCGHNDIEWNKGEELAKELKQFIDYDVDNLPMFVQLDNVY